MPSKKKRHQPHRRRDDEAQLNIDLPKELVASLEVFCEEARMTRKAIIELAVRRWLNDRKQTARV